MDYRDTGSLLVWSLSRRMDVISFQKKLQYHGFFDTSLDVFSQKGMGEGIPYDPSNPPEVE